MIYFFQVFDIKSVNCFLHIFSNTDFAFIERTAHVQVMSCIVLTVTKRVQFVYKSIPYILYVKVYCCKMLGKLSFINMNVCLNHSFLLFCLYYMNMTFTSQKVSSVNNHKKSRRVQVVKNQYMYHFWKCTAIECYM